MAIDSLATHTSAESGAYVPPVSQYQFLLGEAFGTDIVARSTGGALTTEDALDAISAAGEFSSEVFARLNTVGDQQGAQYVDGGVRTPDGFKEAYKSFAEAGWISASASEESGGEGLPATVTAALNEFWNGSNMAFALCPGLSLGSDSCSHCVWFSGTARRLPAQDGEW